MNTNTKSFLEGIFYIVYMMFEHPFYKGIDSSFCRDLDSLASSIPLFTKNCGKLLIEINGGFSPISGRVPMCSTNIQDCSFRIYKDWVNDEMWFYLKQYVDLNGDEFEAYLDFEELTNLIDLEEVGGLDLERMKDFVRNHSNN